MRPWSKWLVTLFCLTAAGLSLWLTVEKWSGRIDSLAGCGAGSGCANVLGSKWSMVFGVVPVSVFSFLLYISVLASLRCRDGVGARWMRALAAWVCLWAALWFTGLQAVVLKSFCPYCMSMHGVGVLLGLSILLGEGMGFFKGRWLPMALAACAVAGLAWIQHLGPAPSTHRVDVVTDQKTGTANDAHALGHGRKVTFLNGSKSYNIEQLPHLGPADAEYVMVEYFDYTCEACRDMHGLLEKSIARHSGKLAVIVLPVPLESSCNPHLPQGVKDHENACHFAKLALKVWRADASMFAEFHRNLFDFQGMPAEAAAALASSLVGEEKMTVDHDAWVNAILSQNVADYQIFIQKTPVMPKLLLKDSVMVQGLVNEKNALEALLEEYLGLENSE